MDLLNDDEIRKPHYAGFWIRAAAAIVESIILFPVGYVEGYVIGFTVGTFFRLKGFDLQDLKNPDPSTMMVLVILAVILVLFTLLEYWLYVTLLESSPWQGTLGKKIFGLKVTDENGCRISFAQANHRFWLKFLFGGIFLFGYITVAFNLKKQGIYDRMARTLVLKGANEQNLRSFSQRYLESEAPAESFSELTKRVRNIKK